MLDELHLKMGLDSNVRAKDNVELILSPKLVGPVMSEKQNIKRANQESGLGWQKTTASETSKLGTVDERGERSRSTVVFSLEKKQNNRPGKTANKEVSFFNLSKFLSIGIGSLGLQLVIWNFASRLCVVW